MLADNKRDPSVRGGSGFLRRRLVCLAAAALLVPMGLVADEPVRSIHAIELERHRGVLPGPDGVVPRLPRGGRPLVTRDLFGWLPYWEWSSGTILSKLRFDLLTHVAYFAGEMNSSGNLTSTHSWSTRGPMLISAAHPNQVKVLLAITNFSPSSLATLLGSATNRQNAINNMVAQLLPYGADGIAVDFEGLPSSQKTNFVVFLKDLKAALQAAIPGSDLWVATPAVDWSGAFDYDLIMDNVDGVFIMAYGYHYGGSSQAGPVSPLTSGSIWTARDVMWTINDYKTWGIARAIRKVSLGFPYYGYDWPTVSTAIPSQTTGSGSAVMYRTAAVQAQTYGRGFDPESQTPYYMYNTGSQHQVWYDDEVSLGLKYDAINSERMGGAGMWALGYDGTRTELWDEIQAKLTRTSLSGLRVGIDAGHGGADTGAVGPTGLTEKEVTLAIALALRDQLQAAGATVIMSRTTDRTLAAATRVAGFNWQGVDRAISIHLGSNGDPSVAEIRLSVYGTSTAGSLADSRSESWGETTVARLTAFTGLAAAQSDIGSPGLHTLDSPLVRDTEMTSIEAVVSTITNAAEEARLRDPGYLCAIAYELYRGLADSFGLMAIPSTCTTSRPVMLAGKGPAKGNAPRFRAFELAGGQTPVLDVTGYGATGYGVKPAGGNIDGVGAGEILTGPGPGVIYGPQVKAFDSTGSPIPRVNFYAYGTLRFGVNTSSGDVDGLGRDAILTGAGPGAVFGPHVRGFDGASGGVSPIPGLSFFAFKTLKYGVRVSGGDLSGNGVDELAAVPGPGAIFGAQVRGFRYPVAAMAKVNFFAFSNASYGAKAALASVDGDLYAEILAGRGANPAAAAQVRGFDYDAVSVGLIQGVDGIVLGTSYGVNVGGSDLDQDGMAELVVGGGPDPAAASRVRAFDVAVGGLAAIPGFDFSAFASSTFGIEAGGADIGP